MKRILVIADYESSFSRSLLSGVIRYSKDYGPWTFYRLPAYYKSQYGSKGIIKWAKEWGADAIIAQLDTEKSALLKDLDIPVILQNFKERSDFFSNITGDYFGAGVMAAQFFAKKGYKNFAFYGNKNALWSLERAAGFRTEIEKLGGSYFYFETEQLEYKPWDKYQIKLNNWLFNLPKPIALFACDDSFALQISETCKINNINVPEDIAILGVDNDDMLCNLSDPPISSIVLDVEKGGYEAGRLLHKQIEKELTIPFNIVINAVKIEARKSTEKFATTNKHILKLLKHIEVNFASSLTIDDCQRVVPLSRRLLESKFKQELGTTIHQYIINYRIDHFSQLLINSDKSMVELAFQSGFNDLKNVFRTFKRIKKCSPAEYRKRIK